MTPADAAQGGRPGASFGLLKFVSWGTLALTLLSSLFLSLFLANQARDVLLEKQHDFAQLLAATLNAAVSKRFYIPNFWVFGRPDLSNPEQYKRLDEVIKGAMDESPARDVRLYDLSGVVVYAQDRALLGREGLGGEALAQAMDQEKYAYEFIYQTGALGAFFSAEIAPNSVVMRTRGPLRIKGFVPVADQPPAQGQEQAQEQGEPPSPGEAPGGSLVEVEGVIGGLEFTLDITADYRKLVTFQRLITLSALGSSLVLFFVLRMLIHRADRLGAQRMREKEEYEREALQNEKLVSMGRMVAGIAHEIRNPLGIIRSSSELLLARAKDKDPLTAKILAAIHEEAVRLSKTVGDFLDYARPKALKLEPVDLCAVLDQCLAFLEQKCRAQGVEVVRACEPGVMVPGDKDLLYRALYNILANALEAMAQEPGQACAQNPEGDGPETLRGQIVVESGEEGGRIRLRVTDTGPGIPPAIRDKLLDPFFTTKPQGTGLGLAITASILRSHGAELRLGDNPEGGARVDILFPRP
ncbi:Sensor protein ZraS [Fundidesulfovibrio magnetotacticus]|uniref:histidine kinase n=1 Tax=Fundidesulfovibrio magnetotacticus TaxID=2730080 RepID=A0A6V8LQZ9_9BACT|nr:HAMP domain-containing sensor histidine kinase [Fundidesulfovibrio magnetotacticus]GFK92981.1 Sensor protein ZraS [Fundidesulfovibrio magnetotacticus]